MSMTPSRRAIEAMTLGGMAIDNRTLIVNCRPCRRMRTFLAADLAKVYGENHSPHTLFKVCSRCGHPVHIGFGFPHEGDKVCRPSALTVWKWREHVYSRDK